MDLIERQLELMDTLLRSASRDARDPEAFKLYFGVYWKDMANPAGGRTGQFWEPQVRFSCVLCRDDQVLAAAVPRLLPENGAELPLFSHQLAALRAAGIPLFADSLTQWKGEDGELVLNLRSRDCPSPSGWLFPTVCIPWELSGLLYKKGMISGEYSPPGSSMPVPTGYGNQLGLCRTSRYGKNPAGCPRPAAGLCCSAAGWVNRVRLGEHPWGGGPHLPLAGDCLTDVFQGLGRLTGTDATAQAFYTEAPPWLLSQLHSRQDGQWDGSLDGLIHIIWDLRSPNLEPEIMWAFQLLLVEPFCLLEEIRSLEEKHCVQLEEVRNQNKILKKELERMNFDGNAC